jgi:hypothetical protein
VARVRPRGRRKLDGGRQAVKCEGDLIREGRGLSLQNTRHFKVVVSDDA